LTYGELRKQLAECDAKWMPDPSIADEQLVPEHVTGGQEGDPPGEVIPPGGVLEVLRDSPPSNPELREVWRREGLLGKQPPRRD
jgi:hypothetical protein